MIIAANFKTNHTRSSTKEFVLDVSEYLETNTNNEVYIFPSTTALDKFDTVLNLHLGVQNAYHVEQGSYTGEIGSIQLEEFAIKTLLLGHSERRHILKESQELITKKFNYYKDLGYKIIYCIGEPLEIKNISYEETMSYLWGQLDGIDISYEHLILAYEPIWAIGTGISATSDDIKAIHCEIKEKIDKPLLYGGSVKVNNVRDICLIDGVDGVLIGTASWNKEDFIQILESTKDI